MTGMAASGGVSIRRPWRPSNSLKRRPLLGLGNCRRRNRRFLGCRFSGAGIRAVRNRQAFVTSCGGRPWKGTGTVRGRSRGPSPPHCAFTVLWSSPSMALDAANFRYDHPRGPIWGFIGEHGLRALRLPGPGDGARHVHFLHSAPNIVRGHVLRQLLEHSISRGLIRLSVLSCWTRQARRIFSGVSGPQPRRSLGERRALIAILRRRLAGRRHRVPWAGLWPSIRYTCSFPVIVCFRFAGGWGALRRGLRGRSNCSHSSGGGGDSALPMGRPPWRPDSEPSKNEAIVPVIPLGVSLMRGAWNRG